jgi:Domain of unknown function (DUF4148)
MKRQVIAVVLGSLFALPAFANYEIDAGNLPQAVASTKSRAQVGQELIAAKQSGNWMVNAQLGTVSGKSAPVQFAGKSRNEVRAELEQAYRSGEMIANAELGTTRL